MFLTVFIKFEFRDNGRRDYVKRVRNYKVIFELARGLWNFWFAMHILIEHILTGSTNRPLYESLWNLSISKTVKPNQRSFSDNQSVVEIW